MNKLSFEEAEKQIRKHVNDGLSDKEIGKKMSMTAYSVFGLRSFLGIYRRGQWNAFVKPCKLSLFPNGNLGINRISLAKQIEKIGLDEKKKYRIRATAKKMQVIIDIEEYSE